MKVHNQQMIAQSTKLSRKNETLISKSMDKLSSGIKVKQASDNAAGLAIGETMKAQIRGLSQAQRNMQDGLSVLEAADEGLNHVNQLLQRAREISVNNANGTLTDSDRAASQIEMDEIMQGINDTATRLEFNTQKILGKETSITLMVGPNPFQKIDIELMDVSTEKLGLIELSISSQRSSEQAITLIDNSIQVISSGLTKIGSYHESIQHHLANAAVYEANMTSSVSKIQDTDMAKEMLNFISSDLRQKGDQLFVSQINQNVQDVLKLLK